MNTCHHTEKKRFSNVFLRNRAMAHTHGPHPWPTPMAHVTHQSQSKRSHFLDWKTNRDHFSFIKHSKSSLCRCMIFHSIKPVPFIRHVNLLSLLHRNDWTFTSKKTYIPCRQRSGDIPRCYVFAEGEAGLNRLLACMKNEQWEAWKRALHSVVVSVVVRRRWVPTAAGYRSFLSKSNQRQASLWLAIDLHFWLCARCCRQER